MTIHELKINPQYLDALLDGSKRCEIRKNDRGYKVGDRLVLNDGKREFWVDVLRIDDFKQIDDYVVMSVTSPRDDECEYCEGYDLTGDYEPLSKDGAGVEITIYDGRIHLFGYDGEWRQESEPINFCPMCGRSLK